MLLCFLTCITLELRILVAIFIIHLNICIVLFMYGGYLKLSGQNEYA